MDSFIKSRIKNKRQQPPLLDEIIDSSFELARAKFDYDKTLKANNSGHVNHKPPINSKYSNIATPLVRIKEKDHLQHNGGNNSHYFLSFDNKNRSPEYFTKKLSDPIHKNGSIKTLIRLELHLKTASISWMLKFVEIRGVQLLVNSLKYCINTNNHCKESIKMTEKSSDSSAVVQSTELEYKILDCFKALANNYIGIREFFANPRYIEEITHSICSPSITCRKLVCEILTFMCYYKAPQGQALVLDAMKKLAEKNVYIKSDSMKGVNMFEVWIKSWKQVIHSKILSATEECEYSLYNLMLVNAIISVIDNPKTRNDLRKQMESCGLETVLDTAVRNEEIYKQIEEFYTQAKQDQPPKKRENITTNDNISVSPITRGRRREFKNLIDPHHIFDLLLDNIEGSGCYDHFLNSIQNMLMYISMSEDHNEKIGYFKNIDSYIVTRSNNNSWLTYEESTKIIEEQKEKLTLLDKDVYMYKNLYENSVNNHDNNIGIEELNDQKEKNKSLEDFLRMSRHTISILQQKLKDIQEDYEDNIVTLEQQLDQFYKVIEAVHNDSENSSKSEEDDITINKKEFASSFARMKARHSLGDSIDENEKLLLHDLDNNTTLPSDNSLSSNTKAQRRTTAMSITEEFKLQLAMQFSTTNISDLVSSANDKRQFGNTPSRRRHSIMVNNSMTMPENKKLEKARNRFTLAPGSLSYKEEQMMLAEPFTGFNLTLNSTMAHVPFSQRQDLQQSKNTNQQNGRKSHSSSLSNSTNVIIGPSPSSSLESLLSNNNSGNIKFGMDSANSLLSDELVPAVSLSGSSISSEGSTWSSQKTYCSTTTDESITSLRSLEESSSIMPDANLPISEQTNTMDPIIKAITEIYEHPPAPPPPPFPLSQPHSNLISLSDSTYLSVSVNNNSILNDSMSFELAPVPPPPPPPPSSGSYPRNNSNNNKPALLLDVENIQASNRKEIKHCPSVKTRILQWQKLHKDSIQSTIWCETNQKSMLSDMRKPQSHQNLKSTMDKAGLFKKMEETFGHTTKTAGSSNKKHGTTWNKKTLMNKRDNETRILEAQKSANISISVLTKLKHSSIAKIKNSILNLDSAIFDEILLESLLNNLPTNQEINKLQDISASLKQQQQQEEVEDEENLILSKSDAFCLEVISIPRYRERIGCMLLKINFQDRISHISKNMAGIMEASTVLRNSVSVKEFLNLVLLIGNFLNGSNFQGGAFGIRIASINKLIDTKSSSNDTTLMHFIIDMMETQFPDIFCSLIPDMKLCVDACRVTLQDLINDYSELKADLDKLAATLQSTSDNDEIFHTKMSHFQREAMVQFDLLEVRYTSMDVAYKDVLLYFGEDPCDMKPDEFFGIFVKFISDWESTRKYLVARRKKIECMNRVHQFEEERKLLKREDINKC